MVTVQADELLELVTEGFERAGAPAEVSRFVAGTLVAANLAGHDSHGVMLAKPYLKHLREGRIRPAAEPVVVSETTTTVVVDGRWAFGQVASRFALGLALDRAREHGLGAASVRRMNHNGRIGEWAERAAAQGMIGLAVCSRPSPPLYMAPYGSITPMLGTNPIAIAFPVAGEAPVLLDYATSIVAGGKCSVAISKGEEIPEGWIVDRDGQPSTNPSDLFNGGAIFPFGGYKGYALGVIVALLSTSLAGVDIVQDEPGDEQKGLGGFFLCINPEAFVPRELYEQSVGQMVAHLRTTPPVEPFERVFVPGEPEALSRERRRQAGIPLPESVWADVQAAVAAPL